MFSIRAVLRRSLSRVAILVFLSFTTLLYSLAGPSLAQNPPWAEPRALSVFDMAGQVPDSVLAGHIICYGNPGGLAILEATSQSGDALRLQVRAYPRFRWSPTEGGWVTDAPLLGHKPSGDRMSASVPAASLRVYANGVDITDQVVYYNYIRPTLALPHNGNADPRYNTGNVIDVPPRHIPADGIPIPANWGGSFSIRAVHRVLTLIWTVRPTSRPSVRYVGEESFSYPSYIGPGFVGWFEKLMAQMRSRYADRHPRFTLHIPPAANYLLFVYEPMPFDLDTGYWSQDQALYEQNKEQPIAGTVRLSPGEGMLSQDLSHGGAFPLRVWWQDADQSAGPYLSVFDSSTRPIGYLTPPEFVLLPGTAYNACFKNGGCNRAVLEDIYNRRAPLKVVYLAVDPLYSNTQALPLRMADTNWQPGLSLDGETLRPRPLLGAMAYPLRAVLPLIVSMHQLGPPLPGERPLGLFEPQSGRMVGYLVD